VECNLTTLCLRYFTFECFEKDIEQDRLRQFALKGYFAFQDYAIAKWFHHFLAMVDEGKDLLSGGDDNQAALEEVGLALDDFANSYEEDILHEVTDSKSEEACRAFNGCGFYDTLLSVWSHIYRHQNKGYEARNDVSIKALSKSLTSSRKLIEGLPSSDKYSGQLQNLDSFYGEKRYKCTKLNCFYFHEGFKDAKSRDTHINRHDRPFNCDVPDCSIAEFGLSSNKDLERHKRSYHPEPIDQANTFTAVARAPDKTLHPCTLCDKRFTRKVNLQSHVDNHKGKRPFDCKECGKCFTRKNDLFRHNKIHARR
jgi:Zinc finger, C2H2 type